MTFDHSLQLISTMQQIERIQTIESACLIGLFLFFGLSALVRKIVGSPQ